VLGGTHRREPKKEVDGGELDGGDELGDVEAEPVELLDRTE
jgi:hypothetical protein